MGELAATQMVSEAGDLGHFTTAVELTASLANGFGLAEVRLVPWGWQIIEKTVSRFGWVVLLQGPRRVYVHYHVDEANGAAPDHLQVEALEPGVRRPALSDAAVHWFILKHVNRALGLPERAEDRPDDLRELARRTRYLATAVVEPDRSRMLGYANELEAVAATLDEHEAQVSVGRTPLTPN